MVRKFHHREHREKKQDILFMIVIFLLFFKCATVKPHKTVDSGQNKEIKATVSASSFNPSLKKKVDITVAAPAGYSTVVTMNDAHGLPIKTLYNGKAKPELKLSWDGTDDSGEIVPDEAYYPMVKAIQGKDTIIYNPPLFSGGEIFTIKEAEVNLEKGTISYTLKKNSRIMIRAGEKKGILLKSIVHCVPRLKGSVTEYWNGKDPDNLLSTKDLDTWALIIAGYTLPDNSIITYGNKKMTYNDYFLKRFPEHSNTLDFPNTCRAFMDTIAAAGRKVNMHFTYPLAKDHSPGLVMEFPNSRDTTESGVQILQGLQRAYLDIDPEDKLFHREQQFELCFFIDGKFVSEDEIGYVPYNWIWNTAEVEEGEHIVTVNVSSFKDQIGTKSVKVYVKK